MQLFPQGLRVLQNSWMRTMKSHKSKFECSINYRQLIDWLRIYKLRIHTDQSLKSSLISVFANAMQKIDASLVTSLNTQSILQIQCHQGMPVFANAIPFIDACLVKSLNTESILQMQYHLLIFLFFSGKRQRFMLADKTLPEQACQESQGYKLFAQSVWGGVQKVRSPSKFLRHARCCHEIDMLFVPFAFFATIDLTSVVKIICLHTLSSHAWWQVPSLVLSVRGKTILVVYCSAASSIAVPDGRCNLWCNPCIIRSCSQSVAELCLQS